MQTIPFIIRVDDVTDIVNGSEMRSAQGIVIVYAYRCTDLSWEMQDQGYGKRALEMCLIRSS